MARSEIEKILDKDSLQKALDELVEINPEHVILAYQESGKNLRFYTYWYGGWPTCIGLSELLHEEILGGGPEDDGEKDA